MQDMLVGGSLLPLQRYFKTTTFEPPIHQEHLQVIVGFNDHREVELWEFIALQCRIRT
jgi:hypothetical protein